MNIHRKTKLTPFHREEIWRLHHHEKLTVTYLAERFMVSRPTIYKVLKQGRLNLFVPLASKNERYRTIKYGIKRLTKVEKAIEERLKNRTREYLFVGIDDFSRELYAGIYPDKSQFSAANFLHWDLLEQCPYTVECIYSDNGREYKGTIEHAFVEMCLSHKINQKFTKPACPQTNGKAERVIRTLMEMWHNREEFVNSEDRKKKLKRFLNYYNTVKPHKGINGLTPYEILENYFNTEV